MLGENSLKLPQVPELHISIFIKQQQQQARWAHSRPSRSESSNIKQIAQGLYRYKFSVLWRQNNLSAGVITWWVSDVRGSLSCKDVSFAQGRKKHSSTLLITSGPKHVLAYLD